MEPTTSNSNFNFFEEENLDIKRYLSMFVSNWYWFAVALFIALSFAYGINRYSEKVYAVSATLLIKDDQKGGGYQGTESVIPGGNIFRSQQNLVNEIGILKSFSLNYMTMEKLPEFQVEYISVGKRGIVESRMYKTCPFKVVYDSLILQPKGVKVNVKAFSETELEIEIDGKNNIRKNIKIGERFSGKGFDFTIELRDRATKLFDEGGSNRYYFYFADPESLANQYRANLSVAPIEKEASLVVLSASGLVADQVADYLNKLMDVYKDYGLDIKNQTAEKTIKFIDEQLVIISDSLSRAEDKLEKFRLSNKFFDLSREGAAIQSRLENFESEKISFELQLRYYNYLSDYLGAKNSGGTIISPAVMGITDPVLLRLVNELSVLEAEQEKLGFNYDSNQPAIGLLLRQIEEKRQALRENIRNGIANIQLSINEADKKIKMVEVEINKLPTTEKKLIGIQRKFDLNNTVYTYLLEKRAESDIARASNVSDNRIIDKASQSRAGLIRPKTRMNYITAVMLGILIPLILIILIDYLNDKIIDKKDVEKKTKVPIIGFVSHYGGTSEIPVIEKPGSSFSESFRSIRTSIKYFIPETDIPVIAVSSTISSEGKSFISINLASVVALLGKKVLLIGLDLRKPRIDKLLSMDESPGMSTYLSGNCKYEEIIKKTDIDNLFYAPSGPVPPNPAELIERETMKTFMDKAKKEYDYIIMDTPPVAIVTDTMLLVNYVNLNLFIVRQKFTSRNTLEIIDQIFRRKEMKNMAIVINDISLSGYYGYGMRYGYALGSGYMYGYNYYGKGYYSRYGSSSKAKTYYGDEDK
jgi:capsular exopolysaccharide synthesis family protein